MKTSFSYCPLKWTWENYSLAPWFIILFNIEHVENDHSSPQYITSLPLPPQTPNWWYFGWHCFCLHILCCSSPGPEDLKWVWFIQVLCVRTKILHHWIFICKTYRLLVKSIHDSAAMWITNMNLHVGKMKRNLQSPEVLPLLSSIHTVLVLIFLPFLPLSLEGF